MWNMIKRLFGAKTYVLFLEVIFPSGRVFEGKSEITTFFSKEEISTSNKILQEIKKQAFLKLGEIPISVKMTFPDFS